MFASMLIEKCIWNVK